MMRYMILRRLFAVCCSVFVLNGCHEKSADYDYLMTHPKKLEKEAIRCRAMVTSDADCDVVKRAADDFVALVNERGNNPEGFGKQILMAQMKLASTQQELLKADAKTKEALANDCQAQEANLAKIMAVVSATTGID